MTVQEAKHFLQEELTSLLEKLQTDSLPKWGSMEAQEMVEHIAMALKGGYSIEFTADKEPKPAQEQAKQTFLYQNQPYPQGVPSPFHKFGKPAYMFPTIDDAKHNLEIQVRLMYTFFEKPENAGKCFYHPYFGKINFDDMQLFNYKHIKHHFEQFGLM